MNFLSVYWMYFKKLWTNIWFYVILIMIVLSEQPWTLTGKVIAAVILIVMFPILVILFRWFNQKFPRQ